MRRWGGISGASTVVAFAACVSVSVVGGDIDLVGESLAAGVLEAQGFDANRTERAQLDIKAARALPRGVGGAPFTKASTHTAESTTVHGGSKQGVSRVTIVEASAAVWPSAGVLKTDRVSGTVLWLQGSRMVETWCFSFVRDDVDPDCATQLMSGLATAVGAKQET